VSASIEPKISRAEIFLAIGTFIAIKFVKF
jgi:hypothetical protein